HDCVEPVTESRQAADITMYETQASVAVGGQILSRSGTEIVEDDDFVFPRQEQGDEVGADESSTPGHQDAHRETPQQVEAKKRSANESLDSGIFRRVRDFTRLRRW